ncbi:MAG: sulfotransferase [Acidiferrobacter sp.]
MRTGLWPNLYIVGAVKSGTTSLYAYLRQHPAVFFPEMKEPHFFTRPSPSATQAHLITYIRDEFHYRQLYAGSDRYRWRGDASPSYLWCAEAPARIAAVAADARILLILRDPVERAYAQYLMDHAEGAIEAPFMAALERDWTRPDKGWGVSQLYVELGQYAAQVRRYRQMFGTERVLVLLLDDLKRDPRAVLQQIAAFLEIAAAPIATIDTDTAHNHYRKPKGEWARRLAGSPLSRFLGEHVVPRRFGEFVWEQWMQKEAPKPPMDPRARDYLAAIYAPEIAALEREIGRPLPELRQSWGAWPQVACG